jgi:hypothetical protein
MNTRTKKYIYIVVAISLLAFLYVLKNTSYFVRSLAFIASFLVFFIIDTLLKLHFSNRHYIIFLIIATTGILFSPLYTIYSWYDKSLHIITPILFCILIFYLINKLKNIPLSIKIFLVVSVVVALLAFWEVIEFAIEETLGYPMQGVYIRDISPIPSLKLVMDKNDDTMVDLIFGVLGTISFAIAKTIGFYYNNLNNKNIEKNKKKK